jgi:hypothetical protein
MVPENELRRNDEFEIEIQRDLYLFGDTHRRLVT